MFVLISLNRDSDQFSRTALLGFILFGNAVVDRAYILLAGKGLSQAEEEDSSGIGIHRLGL